MHGGRGKLPIWGIERSIDTGTLRTNGLGVKIRGEDGNERQRPSAVSDIYMYTSKPQRAIASDS